MGQGLRQVHYLTLASTQKKKKKKSRYGKQVNKKKKKIEVAHTKIAKCVRDIVVDLSKHRNNKKPHLTSIVALCAHNIPSPSFSSQSCSVQQQKH